jgi:hypothetical protein
MATVPDNNGSEIVVIKTITVSIGRAVGNEPMDTRNWRKFVRVVNTLVADNATDVWVRSAKSFNTWVSIPEESRTWVFDLDSGKIEHLDTVIESIRLDFGQDAIARTSGTTRLVGIN